ncbi:Uncharacterized protein HZ326_30920 [Fusarium oxysporum f. sp. albedinis]|nr:Uncharacterized protein HZ326_30920 [Fusarium oxysporum f. sp. albedinis]
MILLPFGVGRNRSHSQPWVWARAPGAELQSNSCHCDLRERAKESSELKDFRLLGYPEQFVVLLLCEARSTCIHTWTSCSQYRIATLPRVN